MLYLVCVFSCTVLFASIQWLLSILRAGATCARWKTRGGNQIMHFTSIRMVHCSHTGYSTHVERAISSVRLHGRLSHGSSVKNGWSTKFSPYSGPPSTFCGISFVQKFYWFPLLPSGGVKQGKGRKYKPFSSYKGQYFGNDTRYTFKVTINPLTPTGATWVQL